MGCPSSEDTSDPKPLNRYARRNHSTAARPKVSQPPVSKRHAHSQGQSSGPKPTISHSVDKEIPGDLGAFYGHPFSGINGDKDETGSARALLHEFENLPEINSKLDITEYLP